MFDKHFDGSLEGEMKGQTDRDFGIHALRSWDENSGSKKDDLYSRP